MKQIIKLTDEAILEANEDVQVFVNPECEYLAIVLDAEIFARIELDEKLDMDYKIVKLFHKLYSHYRQNLPKNLNSVEFLFKDCNTTCNHIMDIDNLMKIDVEMAELMLQEEV